MQISKDHIICFVLFCIGLFVFTRGLNVHGFEYRDDEIFYFKSTHEMQAQGNFLSPTYFEQDRFQKPILFYWLILLSYKVFGSSWFAARFVAAVLGSLTVCITWLMARDLFSNRKVATLSAFMLMTLPMFFRHAKNAVPDMPLNFFIVLAIFAAIRFVKYPEQQKYSWLFFISCGLGFMIKGFAALIFPFLTILIYALWDKNFNILKQIKFGRGGLILLVIILPWFLYMIYTHGSGYLDYMVGTETKNRLIGTDTGNPFILRWQIFWRHLGAYALDLLQKFSPWSPLTIFALIFAFIRIKKKSSEYLGLRWMVIWFFSVLFFFSFMSFKIGHYILVLSTPFVILISYFILEGLKRENIWSLLVTKYCPAIMIWILMAAYGFIHLFLARESKLWLAFILILFISSFIYSFRSKERLTIPLYLSFVLLFFLSQNHILDKARLTHQSTLRHFAQTINDDQSNDKQIAVGSHGIHEKQCQIYFEEKIFKAGRSNEPETTWYYNEFIQREGTLYFLLKKKDYEYYRKGHYFDGFEIVQNDQMIKKKFHLDKGFLVAMLKVDQEKVKEYLMDQIILLRRSGNA